MAVEYSFRLFSYLSMTILSIAILVGILLMVQHLEDEAKADKTLQNQKILFDSLGNITKNQELIQVVIKETRRDNGAFFKILEGMIQAEHDEFKRIDKIMTYFNITS